jgi:hypothetical protein
MAMAMRSFGRVLVAVARNSSALNCDGAAPFPNHNL